MKGPTSRPCLGDQLELVLTMDDSDDKPAPRRRWAWLLRHVFAEDLESCIRCGGPMRWLEVATTPEGHRPSARRARARQLRAASATASPRFRGAARPAAVGGFAGNMAA